MYKGFTLVETLVTVSIAALLMTVVIFSYGKFSAGVEVTKAAQEVLFTARNAQTYAISGKEATVGSGVFDTGYGIAFDLNDAHAYYLFVDRNGNKIFDTSIPCGTANSECVEKGILPQSISLSSLCGNDVFSMFNCPIFTAKKVTIVFKRPISEPVISLYTAGNTLISNTYKDVQVSLVSNQGKSVTVTLTQSGKMQMK